MQAEAGAVTAGAVHGSAYVTSSIGGPALVAADGGIAVGQVSYGHRDGTVYAARLEPRPKQFVGRDELLKQLRARVEVESAGPVIVALQGLGGAGKTTLAVEYSHRFVDRYQVVWHFHAEDPTALLAQHASLIRLLDPNDVLDRADPVARVHAALVGLPGLWLLVLDNVRDAVAARRWLPGMGRGHVLVTTQDGNWPHSQALEVGTLDLDSAAKLLLDRTGEKDFVSARAVATELGLLPLALAQAAGYIETTGRSLKKYLELLQADSMQTLARGAPTAHAVPVVATWALAFKELTRSSPGSVSLLRLLSCLAPEKIPFRLLLEEARPPPAPLEAEVSEAVTGLCSGPFALDDAVAGLRRHSLIGQPSDGVTVHRLVQAVTLNELNEAQRTAWSAAAAALVESAIPTDTSVRSAWPACAALLPHAQLVLSALSDGTRRLAGYLGDSGDYVSARTMWSDRAAALALALGDQHPETLSAQVWIARWTGRSGDYVAARDQFRVLLTLHERILGPRHRETLFVQALLAHYTGESGDAEFARDLYVALVPQLVRLHGADHCDTLEARHNLATWTGKAGEPLEARKMCAALLPLVEHTLGPEHPETLGVRASLADWTGSAGAPLAARELYAAMLPLCEHISGPEHPHVLEVRNRLAFWAGQAGRAIEARDEFAALLPLCERILGAEHPLTRDVRENLAYWAKQSAERGGIEVGGVGPGEQPDDDASTWAAEDRTSSGKVQRRATALVRIGTAVAKSAAKLWLRDRVVAADPSANAVDILADRTANLKQRRKVERTFGELADTIADRVRVFVDQEFQGLPDYEIAAVLYVVQESIDSTSLADDDLFALDLNAAYIYRYFRESSVNIVRAAYLSAAGEELYNLILRECCEYIVQVTMTLPDFSHSALVELLDRQTKIAEELDSILSRLPKHSEPAFETAYRRQIVNVLDKTELFGADISVQRYPLSVAYISLSARTGDGVEGGGGRSVRAEDALAAQSRIVISGQAGSGKTTLLQWVAVRAARGDAAGVLRHLGELVPLFVPLRRYVDRALPTPEQFVEHVGRHIADEMPAGWVTRLLSHGSAVVLVDGVDELPEAQRESARHWLQDLVTEFPKARYIITSRPAAVHEDWMDSLKFVLYGLQPMSQADVDQFVRHWHTSIATASPDERERDALNAYANALLHAIRASPHLRELAQTPLLCALICALNRDRRGQLPANRVELYTVALDMLLTRRDAERGIASHTTLSRTDKMLFLQDIAYWLIRNGRADARRDQVIERIGHVLPAMPQIAAAAPYVYANLVERSGLLHEPVVGRVTFLHRTFQEYLAARGALSVGDVGVLISNAHHGHWREVIVMAVGEATSRDRETIFKELLARASNEPQLRDYFILLAIACLETAPQLSAEVRHAIDIHVKELLPPKNFAAANTLASAGPFVIDLLRQARPTRARDVAATIHAAAEIGGPEALSLIATFGRDARATVIDQLIREWAQFDRRLYAFNVLQHSPLRDGHLFLDDPEAVPHVHLLQYLTSITVVVYTEKYDLAYAANCMGLRALRTTITANCDPALLNGLPFNELSLLHAYEEFIVGLKPNESIRTLGITEALTSKGVDLARLIEAAPNVQHLMLNRTTIRQGEIFNALPASLRSLSLRDTNVRDTTGIERLENLQFLDLAGEITLNNHDIARIAELPNLQEVNLLGTKGDFTLRPLHERAVAVIEPNGRPTFKGTATPAPKNLFTLWRQLPYWAEPTEFLNTDSIPAVKPAARPGQTRPR